MRYDNSPTLPKGETQGTPNCADKGMIAVNVDNQFRRAKLLILTKERMISLDKTTVKLDYFYVILQMVWKS